MSRRNRSVWSPHRREWRRVLAAVFGGTLLAGALFLVLGRIDPALLRGWLPRTRVGRQARPVRPPAPQVVLAQRVAALRGLAAAAEAGDLLPTGERRALVVLDERLVASLVSAHLPATHVVEEFRVHLVGARVEFDDGLALIRLDGRVSLADGGDDVYADLTVFGDLALLPHQPSPETLRARVRVFGVEARRVEVGVRSRQVDRLVERISRARIEELARLGPELDIPVRRVHTFEIPGVGPEGPVRIAPATLTSTLQLVELRAFAGRLWLAVDVAIGEESAPATTPAPAPAPSPPSSPDLRTMDALRAEYEPLRAMLQRHLDDDPVVQALDGLDTDVAFVVPATVVSAVGEEVAHRLLDRVALDLRGIDVEREGEMHKETAVGRIRAGRWRLTATVDRVGGVLRAGTPRVRIVGRDRVAVDLPVRIEEGRGDATLQFEWDSTGIANLVCRDFTVNERVQATVPPNTHVVRGTVRLELDRGQLRLTPVADRRFRVDIRPTDDAWQKARAALARQDKWWRCGMGMNPDMVLAQLERIVARGLAVRLPARLFRTITVAITPGGTLDVEGRPVTVRTRDSRLVLAPERVVFGTRLEVAVVADAGAR